MVFEVDPEDEIDCTEAESFPIDETRRAHALSMAITALELGQFPEGKSFGDTDIYQAPKPEEFVRYAKIFEAYLKGE